MSSITNANICPICLETLVDVFTKTTDCKHSFCKVCIDTWLKNNKRCPSCRNHIGGITENETRVKFLYLHGVDSVITSII